MSTVILRSTGPQNNPSHFTPEFCERLREADPVAYQTDVMGEFADPESGLLNPIALRRHTRETPLELPPEHGAHYSAAIDVGKNRWTLCIVTGHQRQHNTWDDDSAPEQHFQVAVAREIVTDDPEQAWREIAAICHHYRIRHASIDQWAASETAAIARRYGLHLTETAWAGPNRLEAFTNLATILHTGRIELPPDRTLRRDLLSVRKRATQAGYQIILPHTNDGRHCDFAPALAAAIREATHNASGSLEMSLRAMGIHPDQRRSPFEPPLHHNHLGTRWETFGGKGF